MLAVDRVVGQVRTRLVEIETAARKVARKKALGRENDRMRMSAMRLQLKIETDMHEFTANIRA